MSYNGPLPQVVNAGGTGQNTLTNHGVLVGAGTTAITQLSVGTNGQVLIGASAADPAFATLTSSDSSITFTTGANTLSLQVAGGTTTIKTITGNTGGAESPSAGNFNILGTGSITVSGSANTETVQLTGLTIHNVLIGAGTATITNVAPSATSGVPLISQGAAADPAFGTAVVAGGGTGATSFTANGAVISNTTTTGALAAVALASQQFLVGNSGAPTAKSFSVVRQVFTSTGTYTPTSGMVFCDIEVVGGGGGGGSTPVCTASQVASASGGGAGGYARGIFSAATIGASKAVTIGAAGTAGSGGGGGSGGTTSVGATLISATGGGGGSAGVAVAGFFWIGGGGGGSGSLGDFQTTGGSGGTGICAVVGATSFANAMGGAGGSSFFGGGATQTGSINGSSVAGNAATSYGGGGSGACNTLTNTAHDGGAGFKGVVVITEYVIA